MKHLLHFRDDGTIQPLWHPSTPFRERFRLGRAFRAFAEGLDPRDRRGFYAFGVDDDGNAMVGGRAVPMYPRLPVVKWGQPFRISYGDQVRVRDEHEVDLRLALRPYASFIGRVVRFDDDAADGQLRVHVRLDAGPTVSLLLDELAPLR